MQVYCRADYLTSLTRQQTASVESFHSFQVPRFVTFSSLIGTSVFYIARVAAATCKQSQITWGCFQTFFVCVFDIFWNEVISASLR